MKGISIVLKKETSLEGQTEPNSKSGDNLM